jgi:hypothetical protein
VPPPAVAPTTTDCATSPARSATRACSSISALRARPRSPGSGRVRASDGTAKRSILAEIDHAQKAIPFPVALRVLRFSPSRFHAWCRFDGGVRTSCLGTATAQLTAQEIATMGAMVTSPSHRHLTTRALALHAQRTSRLFASPSAWLRLVLERGWLRPRCRLSPTRPDPEKASVRSGQRGNSRKSCFLSATSAINRIALLGRKTIILYGRLGPTSRQELLSRRARCSVVVIHDGRRAQSRQTP